MRVVLASLIGLLLLGAVMTVLADGGDDVAAPDEPVATGPPDAAATEPADAAATEPAAPGAETGAEPGGVGSGAGEATPPSGEEDEAAAGQGVGPPDDAGEVDAARSDELPLTGGGAPAAGFILLAAGAALAVAARRG